MKNSGEFDNSYQILDGDNQIINNESVIFTKLVKCY